ncbi:MAG: NUDIX hydrolase [Acholeplasma sp.]|jgi:ADP-ribose pyrophosphatase|nr:MAG: NUDIX hydrolase [Acholeplasma sp.]
MKEQRIKREKKYETSFLALYEDDVKLENNTIKKRVVIKHPGGACVLPLLPDKRVVLTVQYRYPIESIMIEIPAGKKDFYGEDGLSCAKRELEEETGYTSNDYEHLFTLHPCVGYSDEVLDIFLAKDCIKKENPKAMDEDEDIEVMIVDKEQIKALLRDGQVTDGKTLVALQYYLMKAY